MLESIDLFRQDVPSFNIRGRTTVASWPGAIISLFIFYLLMLYGAHKLKHLISRYNPNVSSYIVPNFFDSTDMMNLKENGIRFAFGVEGFIDKQIKNDPRYVKILTRIWGKKDGSSFEKILPHHKCTAEDFIEFAPPQPQAIGLI